MTEKSLFKTPRTRGHARSRGNIFETFKDNNMKLVQETLLVTFKTH